MADPIRQRLIRVQSPSLGIQEKTLRANHPVMAES
jgi:hypothetical protein